MFCACRVLVVAVSLSVAEAFQGRSPQHPSRAAAPALSTFAATLASPLPAHAISASPGASTTLLASLDAVDYYYGLLLAAGLAWVAVNSGKQLIQEAKSFDERGAMANQMAAEKRKRDRVERREAVRKSEPATYARMQEEAAQRADKKSKWKVFDDE
jgi:hypothetical protein